MWWRFQKIKDSVYPIGDPITNNQNSLIFRVTNSTIAASTAILTAPVTPSPPTRPWEPPPPSPPPLPPLSPPLQPPNHHPKHRQHHYSAGSYDKNPESKAETRTGPVYAHPPFFCIAEIHQPASLGSPMTTRAFQVWVGAFSSAEALGLGLFG